MTGPAARSTVTNVFTRAATRATRVASRLLGNDRVFELFQRGLATSHGLRRWVDRRLVEVWASAGVPSRFEVDRLHGQLDLIEEALGGLERSLREPPDPPSSP